MGFIPADAQSFQMKIDSYGQNDNIHIFTRDGKHLIGTPPEVGSAWSSSNDSSGNIQNATDLENEVFIELGRRN